MRKDLTPQQQAKLRKALERQRVFAWPTPPAGTGELVPVGTGGFYGASPAYLPLTKKATPALWNGATSYGESIGVSFARFGIIDNALLVAMTLAGVSLEDRIAKLVGVKGYGAIVGAALGNAISDGVAALPEGRQAALGVTLGALLPVAPLAIAMGMKKPLKGNTSKALLASSVALLALAFIAKKKG